MRNIHRSLAVAGLAVAALAPAAAAGAATKTQSLGLSKPPAGTPESADFFDFFPRTIKVNVGDQVRYKAGFGVPYFGPKGKIEPLLIGDPARPVTGLTDPAGAPFWFNGQPTPAINPFFLVPAGDGKVGKKKGMDHGALAFGPSEPFVVTFTKPGSYKVYDAVHPDVTGKVVVVPKGKKVPSGAADKARAARQAAKLVKQAKKRANPEVPDNTIRVGNDSKRIAFYEFFPGERTVPVGTTITIDGTTHLSEVHNLAIGPEEYMKGLTGDGKLFQPTDDGADIAAEVIYPSQSPGAAWTFSGTENGGFFNSGTLDTDEATRLDDDAQVTFTAPGTYRYLCLWHSDGVNGMGGTITVE